MLLARCDRQVTFGELTTDNVLLAVTTKRLKTSICIATSGSEKIGQRTPDISSAKKRDVPSEQFGTLNHVEARSQHSHVGVRNLEDRGAQNIHSLDGTKNHPFVTAGSQVYSLTRWITM